MFLWDYSVQSSLSFLVCRFIYFAKFGEFSPSIFPKVFGYQTVSPILLRFWQCNIRPFNVSTDIWDFDHFFQCFCKISFSDWILSIDLCSSALALSIVISFLLSSPYSFPGGSEVTVSACNMGDLCSIPGLGRSPREGNGNSLQYSYLENPIDGGAWWATVHGVAKSWTRLSDFTFFFIQPIGWGFFFLIGWVFNIF